MVYLSRIYTKSGDRGETGLGNGERVPKDHPRVAAFQAGRRDDPFVVEPIYLRPSSAEENWAKRQPK